MKEEKLSAWNFDIINLILNVFRNPSRYLELEGYVRQAEGSTLRNVLINKPTVKHPMERPR